MNTGYSALENRSALIARAAQSVGSRVLNDVRIPVGLFRGADLRRLAAVERFDVRGRRSGSIEPDDIAFQ